MSHPDDPLFSKDGMSDEQEVPSISGVPTTSANDGVHIQQVKRTKWGGKLEFLLTMVSNAVGLGENA